MFRECCIEDVIEMTNACGNAKQSIQRTNMLLERWNMLALEHLVMSVGPAIFVFANAVGAQSIRVSLTDNLKTEIAKQELVNVAIDKMPAVGMIIPTGLFEDA